MEATTLYTQLRNTAAAATVATKQVVVSVVASVKTFLRNAGALIGNRLREFQAWLRDAQLLARARQIASNAWSALREKLLWLLKAIEHLFSRKPAQQQA